MLPPKRSSAHEYRRRYFSPDRGFSDPCISMPDSKLYGGLQEGLRAGIGYSSMAAGWSDDVTAECWSLGGVSL